MRLILVLLTFHAAFASEWTSIERLQPDQKIEITTRNHTRVKATFVSADTGAILVRGQSGQRSIDRTDVRQLRVADPSRSLRNGLIGILAGAGAGAGVGFAVCPQCSNEGNGGKFVAPAVAVGAGLGALFFLRAPYRTIYKSK